MELFKFHNIKTMRTILFNILAILMIFLVFKSFPHQSMKSVEHVDNNGSSCPYYFTLQSFLSSYPLLSSDKANVKLIKNKLIKFEETMHKHSLSGYVVNNYKTPYFEKLAQLNLMGIKYANTENDIVSTARVVYPIVDNYYLDKNINCINIYYSWDNQSRRILRYNLNGLYDQIPNKYSRILMAVQTAWITGSSPGYFILNQTETLDTRFMSGLPLLTALYVLPKSNYSYYGFYDSPGNWRYFNVDMLLDPVTRKVLDISGVDIFTVIKSDIKNKKLPNTFILPSKINPLFGSQFESLVNKQSYGIAYLANNIIYENPLVISQYENVFKQYFSRHDDTKTFTLTTNILYQKLMKLKDRYDVILESSNKLHVNLDDSEKKSGVGYIKIAGIVGERALFNTNCLSNNCIFIFNIGKAPGWHSFVNGAKSPIMRANLAFMATEVPHGLATVWFIYAPWTQLLSYFVSLITLLLIVSLTVFNNTKVVSNSIGFVD